jgi:formylglycine-generating enzyme required for sulfatase activity
MLLALKFKMAIVAAACAAGPMAVSVLEPAIGRHAATAIEAPALVEIKPGQIRYYATGEFTRDGRLADAPQTVVRFVRPLHIMRDQVSVADYRRCVDDGACAALPGATAAQDNLPAVMTSWRDAYAYAD